MKEYVCGIDIGTSALKVVFLAQDGGTLGPFVREIQTSYPRPLYAEQDPYQWLELLAQAFSDAFRTGLVDAAHIRAILPDAATHTVVLLDEGFRPVRPAILWNDQRSAQLAARCEQKELVFSLTNHMPGAMWSLFQNLWVKENEPQDWARVRYMLFAKDFLRYELTGVYCTDTIDAEGSGFYDVRQKCWSEPLCGMMGFPPEQLPPLMAPTDPAGEVTAQAARALGLREGTPVYTGTTDTALELLACGAIRKGQATVKLATSGRICVVADRVYPHLQLVNYSHVQSGLYYPGTGTRSCASSLRWFRDTFASDAGAGGNSFAQLGEEAGKIPPGCEGLLYHPFLLGEFTPYSNDRLRASFTGMSMAHTRAHFVRAVMEGTAYSLKDCLNLLESLGIDAGEEVLLIGGGGNSAVWSGILADVLEKSIDIPGNSNSAFGGALLAGVACGMFSSLEQAVAQCCRVTARIAPNAENARVYRHAFGLYTDMVRALTPLYERAAP